MHAIEIEDVSKRFRLYHEKFTSLKERAIHFNKTPHEDYWALSDISFDIEQGESFGLLGHNGSGKSTLLKCVAGILQPTTGEIRTRGRLASMLELGAGFHPDLTGRENVYLNASLLGLSKKSIDIIFDDIVEFAELEQFIDNQVKFYSSGMYVRLGFAVAVNMDPDILLVDEVLAVGDELFQRKCLDRVRQFQKEGRTIVVVTHSADLIRQVCDRAAVLEQGRMICLDTPGEAIRSYREHLLARQERRELAQEEAAVLAALHDGSEVAESTPEAASEVEQVVLTHGQLQEKRRTLDVRVTKSEVQLPEGRDYLLPGDPLTIALSYETVKPISDVAIGMAVYDVEGRNLFGANTDLMGVDLGTLDGKGRIEFKCESIPLLDGDFSLTIGVHSHDELTVYDWQEGKQRFSVMNPTKNVGLVHIPLSISVTHQGATEISA